MKRIGLWATAVLAILLVATIARASAAERPRHWRTATAVSTTSMTARVFADPVAQGGWNDQDTVETTGIGVLAVLGATALANQIRSARSAKNRQYQQHDELMLNTLDDVLAAVDTYLSLRRPGEVAEASVVREVISGLSRFQRLAGSTPMKSVDDFRTAVVNALTSDLDAHAESESLPGAAAPSKLIHRMADVLRKDIEAQGGPAARSA